jgi:hypothetical protein
MMMKLDHKGEKCFERTEKPPKQQELVSDLRRALRPPPVKKVRASFSKIDRITNTLVLFCFIH